MSSYVPEVYPADRGKKEITLAPHMWRIILKCVGKIKVFTNDGCDVSGCFDIKSKRIILGSVAYYDSGLLFLSFPTQRQDHLPGNGSRC